jgi:hypothetical protein
MRVWRVSGREKCGQNVEQAVYGLFSARIQEKSRCLGITERKRPGQKAAVTDFLADMINLIRKVI